MFAARITLKNADAHQEAFVEKAYWLLGTWYKNGQIVSDTWALTTTYQKLTSMRPEVAVLGPHPESLPPCKCSNRLGYILFTNYLSAESPVRCFECFRPVPLYLLPKTSDEEYLDILHWMADYKACDTLQMNCTVGERFGEKQLSSPDSALSKEGRKLRMALEAKVKRKVYYYLHKSRGRSVSDERKRRCPICRRRWILQTRWHKLFDFRCEHCRLLSNIAFSLGA